MIRSVLSDRIAAVLIGDGVSTEQRRVLRPLYRGGQGRPSHQHMPIMDRLVSACAYVWRNAHAILFLVAVFAVGVVGMALFDLLALSRLS